MSSSFVDIHAKKVQFGNIAAACTTAKLCAYLLMADTIDKGTGVNVLDQLKLVVIRELKRKDTKKSGRFGRRLEAIQRLTDATDLTGCTLISFSCRDEKAAETVNKTAVCQDCLTKLGSKETAVAIETLLSKSRLLKEKRKNYKFAHY